MRVFLNKRKVLSSSVGCVVERFPRRHPVMFAAHFKGDFVSSKLGNKRVGNIGAGRHSRGLLQRHHRSPGPTHTLSYTVSVGQEAACALDRLLDAESLCALGGEPATRAIPAAAHWGVAQENTRHQQAGAGGSLFSIRDLRGGNRPRAGRLLATNTRHTRVCVHKVSGQESTYTLRCSRHSCRLGGHEFKQTGKHLI